jgi:uridine kinase
MPSIPFLVGVAGGSGSGKTSLIRALCAQFPTDRVSVVSQDDYYLPREHQQVDVNGRVNFDLPEGVDLDGLVADLEHLRKGRSLRRREYTFNNTAREAGWVEVRPAPIVLVEGLFVLHHDRLRRLFDLRVFVHASTEVELDRRLRRDAVERGYRREDVLYQWKHHVVPAHEQFLLPHRPSCELHVDNDGSFDAALEQLRTGLMRHAPALEVGQAEPA